MSSSGIEEAVSPTRVLSAVYEMAKKNELPTFEPLLPLLLRLRGQPFTLDHHFHFEPMFRARKPQRIVFMCGRQVGKTTTFAADGCVMAAARPHFYSLFVTPQFEQVRRFSTMNIRPFIRESPLRHLWQSTTTEDSVLQRTFTNGARMLFSFAGLDADRTRGISAHRVAFDELQDMDKDHIPIILETLSADKEYALEQYSGTSKTTTTALAVAWQRSSQAEYWIPCDHCTTMGNRTYNIPSLEYHIERMLGPLHMNISEELAAIVCYKCRRPLRPRTGRWVHRYPERRWDFAGYHIPQPIIPLHYSSPKKWATLLGKRERGAAVFANEVLGEPYDAGQRLITPAELQAACTLGIVNNPREPAKEVMERAAAATARVLAIDWGGGGETGFSYTAFSLLAYTPDGRIDVLWGCRSYGIDHLVEAADALRWFRHFRCDYLVHDYGGAGALRETMLIQAGIPAHRVMPMSYVRSASQNLVVPVPPTDQHTRTRFRLDKTRSLLMTVAAIRLGRVQFFSWDYKDTDNEGLLTEFLRLTEVRSAIEVGGSYYRVLSDATGSDDFAQATNIGCAAIWHLFDAYPHLADAAGLDLANEEIIRLTEPPPEAHPWDDGSSDVDFF